jgi:DNA polymerase-3 subunit epsilon
MLASVIPYLDGALLVAHNAPFDIGQLRAAAARSGVALPRFQSACTVRMARRAFPGRKSYSVGALRDLVGIDFLHHDALWDARACAMLYLACAERLQDTGGA